MADTPYCKLLQDPRWQKKRLEVFERADFKCEECGASEKTLHAHHRIYHKGAMPWEYQDRELMCLCDPCHERWHMLKDYLLRVIADLPLEEITRLAGFGVYCIFRNGEYGCARLSSEAAIDGMARGTGLPAETVKCLLDSEGMLLFQRVTDALHPPKPKRRRKP